MKKTILAVVLVATQIIPVGLVLAAPSSTEILLDRGFEQAGATDSEAAFWSPFDNGYTRTSEAAKSGSYSIKLTNTDQSSLSGAYERIDLNQTTLEPVFIGGYVKGNTISQASGSFLGASMYAEIHLQNGQTVYWNSVPNQGTFDWRWIGFNTGTVASITSPIAYIYIVPILGNASGTAYFDDISASQYTSSQAAVTLMFDDGETTTYTEGKPVLDQYGKVGSAAIITGSMNTDGYMTSDEVKALAASGWDIVSHTITHTDMTTETTAERDNEFSASKATLQNLGLTINSLALPYGAYNADILGQGQQYYSSMRGYELGDNPVGAFPYDIKVRSVIDTTTVADVESWINEAKANNRWEVIVIHEVSNTGDDEYHIAPATFSQMVKAIADSSINVVNYQQGLNLFAVAPDALPQATPSGDWGFTATSTDAIVNQPVTATLNISNSGNASDAIVDMEIYDSENQLVSQKFFEHQNFSQGNINQYMADFTPTAAGRYTVKFGIFNNNWSTNYYWQNAALFIDARNADTDTSAPTGDWGFTASSHGTTINQPVSVDLDVSNSASASDQIVDMEIYNADNQQVSQNFTEHQNFSQGVVNHYNATFTPAAAGRYTVKFGIFNNNWSTNYYWQNAALFVDVDGGQGATTTPPATSMIITLSPTNGQTMSGTQAFQAYVKDRDLSTYTMYWQVDNGQLNQMYDVNSGPTPYKEATVNFDGWNWNGKGPYQITFVAKDNTGTTIANQFASIMVQN